MYPIFSMDLKIKTGGRDYIFLCLVPSTKAGSLTSPSLFLFFFNFFFLTPLPFKGHPSTISWSFQAGSCIYSPTCHFCYLWLGLCLFLCVTSCFCLPWSPLRALPHSHCIRSSWEVLAPQTKGCHLPWIPKISATFSLHCYCSCLGT